MRTFDLITSILILSTSLGLHGLRKKRFQTFYWRWAWHGTPMIMRLPFSSGSKKLNIGAFIWGIICFCTMLGSFRIIKNAGEWRLLWFVFVFIVSKIRQKTKWICQICKNCDQENMKIVKLNILYQMPHLMNAQMPFLWHTCIYVKVHFWWPNNWFFFRSYQVLTPCSR